MDALRTSFEAQYPGEAATSDEATQAWSKAYREMAESQPFLDAQHPLQRAARKAECIFRKARDTRDIQSLRRLPRLCLALPTQVARLLFAQFGVASDAAGREMIKRQGRRLDVSLAGLRDQVGVRHVEHVHLGGIFRAATADKSFQLAEGGHLGWRGFPAI